MSYLKLLFRAILPKKYYQQLRKVHWRFRSQVYWRLRALLYIGNRRICPCCNCHFRKFLSFRARLDAQCPRCGSVERHRLMWLYLKYQTNLFSDTLRLLHFAPEYIFQKNFASFPNLDYVSADLDSPLAMTKVDIMNIPYENNSFDVILCSHVLEHVSDDQKAMRELFRVLMPGGWAILQSPVDHQRHDTFEDPNITSPQDRLRFFGQSNHVRVYGCDYKDRLEKAGFSVEVDGYVRSLGADKINLHGLPEDEFIYLCTKPKLQETDG